MVVAVREPFECPTHLVFEPVIVSAERREVVLEGWAEPGPWCAVVDVAVDRRHAAAREHAGRISSDDVAELLGGGSTSGDTRFDRLAAVGVDHGPAPGRVTLTASDLAGEVGDDRPVSVEIAWMICEPGEGGEVDGEMHRTVLSRSRPFVGGRVAFQEVEGDVGTELVDGPTLIRTAQ